MSWWPAVADASAAPAATVVVVATEGAKAWDAAERRLIAELRAMQLRVLELRFRRDVDKELPRHAHEYGAVAALQVVRNGEQGVIRIWLEPEAQRRAGYSHISVNLRNPDVVSQAVLPAVELVYTRSLLLSIPDAPPAGAEAPAQETRAPGRKQIGAPVFGPRVRYHIRSEMPRALRLGAGPWFSGGETTPALQLTLGWREHFAQHFSLEPEVFWHAMAHHVELVNGTGDYPIFGGRAHLLFEPWSRSSVSVGIGPGVGLVYMRGVHPGEDPAPLRGTLLSGRAQIASATAPFVDVLFVVTFSHALQNFDSRTIAGTDSTMMRPSVDAMLALDWHL